VLFRNLWGDGDARSQIRAEVKDMRHTFAGAIGAFALLLALAVPSTPAAAYGMHERTFPVTLTQVLVNRGGGITISGTLDCSAVVAEAYASAGLSIPEHTAIFVGVRWTATQYVGRAKAVTATYDPGIAHPCFNNDPALDVPVVGPWTWSTKNPYPQGGEQWVYSTNGKFASGPIHVEVAVIEAEDGYTFEVAGETYSLYHWSTWDVRAVKTR
jgi:hypothetical protein